MRVRSPVLQGRVSQLPGDVEAWVHKSTASQSVELQQRAYELLALLTAPPQVRGGLAPVRDQGRC